MGLGEKGLGGCISRGPRWFHLRAGMRPTEVQMNQTTSECSAKQNLECAGTDVVCQALDFKG